MAERAKAKKGRGRAKSKSTEDDAISDGLEKGPTPMETEPTSSSKETSPTSATSSSSTAGASSSASTSSSSKKEELINSLASVTMGTGIDLVFSFDTTGSMYSYLATVRNDIRETAARLLKEIPSLRIAIIAHGDYCDASNYVVKYIDFSTNVEEIENFVQNVPATGGGDAPEAYELAFRVAGDLSWRADASKAFVVIGDAPPHAPSYTDQNIYWRDEVNKLRLKGVKIYGVYCGGFASTTGNAVAGFYEEIADLTGGVFLQLSDIKYITDMFRAVCFREADPNMLLAYEAEVDRREGGMEKGLKTMFRTLSGANRSLVAKSTGRNFPEDWWTRENDKGSVVYKLADNTWVYSGIGDVAAKKKGKPKLSKKEVDTPKKTTRTSRSRSKSPTSSVPKSRTRSRTRSASRSKSPATGGRKTKTTTAAKAKKTTTAAKAKKTTTRRRRPMASIWTLGPLSEPEKPTWVREYMAPSGARFSQRIKDARRKEQRKARARS